MGILLIVNGWALGALAAEVPAVAIEEIGLSQADQELEKIRREIIDSDLRKRRMMRSVLQLNRKIEKIAKEKGRFTDDLLALKVEAKNAAKNIVDLEQKMGRQKNMMGKRLGALYRLSGQSLLRLIFSVNDAAGLERNLRFLSLIVERDHELIKKFRQSVTTMKEERRQLNKKVTAIIGVKNKIKANEAKLLAEQRRRTRLVDSLNRKREKNLSKIRKLHDRQDLNPETEEFAGWHFFEKKGKLALPTRAKLRQGFGLLQGANRRVWLSHKGHLYEPSADGKIFSVGHGKVVFAGALEGFGQVVMVDHGDHYYSVYGHLAEIQVAEGDRVERGEEVAKTKPVGEAEHVGLYFEIRHFSQPEDPLQWLSREEIKVSSVE